ncbi:site-specific integrase [Aerococcaceae bacterium zg-ZUI334]|uniref:tyrosine-type recombinase/integrase n=1 Tax=Aerococcaceae bacterium zg-252 TaxID=2796928 RepID=UPI001B954FF6|nr:site-specific integrase [Aerococcaceae bacterium zg-ZUI334]MBS4461193.1 site-specific integrase [Aerococcaceae bacterium zg-B36]
MWIEELSNGKFKYIERYIDNEGKQRRISLTHEKNTASVRKQMSMLLQDKINEILIVPDTDLTFQQVSEMWLPTYAPTVKTSTLYRIKTHVRALNQALGHITFSDLKAYQFNSFFLDEQTNGRFKYHTLKNMLSTINHIIKFGFKYKGIDKTDLLPLLEIPKINVTNNNEWKYLERDELDGLIEFLEAQELHETVRMVKVQISTGMRFSEMIALNFEEDIDLDNYTIHVRHTYHKDTKTLTTPKTGKERTIYFNEDLKIVLKQQINYTKRKILRNNITRSKKFLFMTKYGYPSDIVIFNKNISKYKLPNKKITSHIFRHTFITRAVEAGISKDLIAKQVGHVDTEMIDKVYLHFTNQMAEQQKKAMLDLKII